MNDIEKINNLALNIRNDILDMTFNSGVNGGHLGGAFSAVEIFATLYEKIMNVDHENSSNEDRDRFILSKGHTAIAHYATLFECGFLTKDEILSFEKSGSQYSTHEVINIDKGIEFTSGSLGYGVSLGVGTALMARNKGKMYHTYVLVGDGECNEGSIWEAIISAVRFKLGNITIIIDVNKQQLDGYTEDIMPINDFATVCRGYGCNVLEIDGNNVKEIIDALKKYVQDKPTVIVANTIKCKGIPSIEGKTGFHHVKLTEEEYLSYKEEINRKI